MRLAIAAAVLVLAVAVAIVAMDGRGNSEDADDPLSPQTTERVTPAAILDVPPKYFRQPVVVTGTVAAVGEERAFALRGGGRAILVVAEPGVSDVAEGDRVEVRGVVNRLDRVASVAGADLAGAPTEEGSPFISADAVDAGT